MKLARGEKIVKSEPRSRIRRSWFVSIDSRNSSSLMRSSDTRGPSSGVFRLAICRLRHSSSAFGAVV
jgi:hypothetical protein